VTDQTDHFERLYQTRDDPWDYLTSPYEAAKYAATLAALTRQRYACALEAGCSIGVLSALLAQRCDRLLSVDLVARAVEKAAARLGPHPGARAMRATLPGGWPQGRYDLILLSELLYYLNAPDIDALARCVARDATAGAEIVLVHYQGETGTDIRPDAARDRFCAVLSGLRTLAVIDHPSPAAYNHRTLLFRA
jgi:SAM-dependent methyltransferase